MIILSGVVICEPRDYLLEFGKLVQIGVGLGYSLVEDKGYRLHLVTSQKASRKRKHRDEVRGSERNKMCRRMSQTQLYLYPGLEIGS